MFPKNKRVFIINIICLFLLIIPNISFAELYMSVSGKVVEKNTGTPLKGIKLVLVSWVEGQIAETVSDFKGNFTLKKVPAGSYSLFDELEDNYSISLPRSIPIIVKKGKNIVGLKVELDQGGAIRGRVITHDNIPIPSASIRATSGRISLTDEDGLFVLKGVTPGKVDILVVPDHISPKNIEANSEKSKIVDVGNIVFDLSPHAAIRGIIVDTTGAPVSYAIINSVSDGHPPVSSMSREDGRFAAAGLEAAKYDLTIISQGYKTKKIKGVEVPTDNIVIELEPDIGPISKSQHKTNFTQNKISSYFSMLLALLSPKEAFARTCTESCLGSIWSGYAGFLSAQVIAVLIPVSTGGTYGKSFCWGTSSKAGYKLECEEKRALAVGKAFSAGIGLGGVYTWGGAACCKDALYKNKTHGGIFNFTPPSSPVGFHYALDLGNDLNHFSLGMDYTKGLMDPREFKDFMKKIVRLEAALIERECQWVPVPYAIISKLLP